MASTADLLAYLDRQPSSETESQVTGRMFQPEVDAGYQSMYDYSRASGTPISTLIQQENAGMLPEKKDMSRLQVPKGRVFLGPGGVAISNGNPIYSDVAGEGAMDVPRTNSLERMRKPIYDALIEDQKTKMLESLRGLK